MKYFFDFDDFGTIRKRLQGAFEWYPNHQNPRNIWDAVTLEAKNAKIA